MRLVLVIVACTAFALLGVRDIAGGEAWVGVASLMLAASIAILLTR